MSSSSASIRTNSFNDLTIQTSHLKNDDLDKSNSASKSTLKFCFPSVSKAVTNLANKTTSRFNAIFNKENFQLPNLKISHGSKASSIFKKDDEKKAADKATGKLNESVKNRASLRFRDEAVKLATALTEPGSRTQKLRVISAALAKLNPDDEADRAAGAKILKALATV